MRSVLVTGGTVRIGAAISERLARDGWRVVTSSHRHDAGADVVADLSTAGGAERLFEAAKELGLQQTVQVVAGGVDNSCMALGAGAYMEGRAYNSLGSSSGRSASNSA